MGNGTSEHRAQAADLIIVRDGRRLVGDLPRRIERWQEKVAFLKGRWLYSVARRQEDLAELQQEARSLTDVIQAELRTLELNLESAPPQVAASFPVANARRSLDGLLQLLAKVGGPVENSLPKS